MTRLAEVCRTKIVHSPSSTPELLIKDCTLAVIWCSPCPRVSTLNCLTIGPRFERGHCRQLLPLEKLEERAARRRDVVDLVADAELVDRGGRIAAARDRESLRSRDRACDRLGALGERVLLEHADRPVPD